MKKLILIALAFAGLSATAGTLGIKPIFATPTCNGSTDGRINAVVVGGTSPYTYYWSNNPGVPGPASETGLAAGTYSVTVYDAGAQDTGTYTLIMGQPDPVGIYPSGQNVSIHGGSDGALAVLVDGGYPDYTFAWSNSATTQDIYNLTAGTYIVTVTDGVGCQASDTMVVSEPAQIHGSHTPQFSSTPASIQTATPVPGGHVKLDAVSSTGDIESMDNSISVFPNPASSYVNLNMENALNSEVTIYNAAGQVVMQKKTEASENKLDISNFSNGNYIVSVNNENGTVSKTISVIK